MTDQREALERLLVEHCYDAVEMDVCECGIRLGGVEECAAHLARIIEVDHLVVPRSDIQGYEYGWRYAEEGFEPRTWTWSVPEGEGAAAREVEHIRQVQREQGKTPNAERLSRPILPWTPIPEGGDQA